jgi:hypothetical protein
MSALSAREARMVETTAQLVARAGTVLQTAMAQDGRCYVTCGDALGSIDGYVASHEYLMP